MLREAASWQGSSHSLLLFLYAGGLAARLDAVVVSPASLRSSWRPHALGWVQKQGLKREKGV